MKRWRGYMQMSRAIGRQDLAAASASCERILAEAPQDGFALAMLAHCYGALGRSREALALAERALEQVPDNFQLLRLATNVSFDLNEHSRGRAFAVRALAANARQHEAPRSIVWLTRLAARSPLLRRALRPEQVAELERGLHERDVDEWQRWAREYVEGPTMSGSEV
jgi:tetratricopeptide (TPR) repeat protein